MLLDVISSALGSIAFDDKSVLTRGSIRMSRTSETSSDLYVLSPFTWPARQQHCELPRPTCPDRWVDAADPPGPSFNQPSQTPQPRGGLVVATLQAASQRK